METTATTPVEIVQELLAIYTTRKEAIDRLLSKQLTGDFGNRLTAAARQNDHHIGELMSELSNYGDGVMASVDRQNEYQRIWNGAIGKIDDLTPEEGEQLFQSLENALQEKYRQIQLAKVELPASLQEMLVKQQEQMA